MLTLTTVMMTILTLATLIVANLTVAMRTMEKAIVFGDDASPLPPAAFDALLDVVSIARVQYVQVLRAPP